MIGKIYGTVDFIKKALDGTWARNEAISNNIANVNTPGYKRVTVEFEDMLKKEFDTGFNFKVTDDKHFDINSQSENFAPKVIEHKNSSTRRDGNNVNIDVEMGELAKNTIMYEALVRQISSEINKIKNVIDQGGK